MPDLIKVVNKFNGNLCCAAHAEGGFIIFECDRYSRVLSYDFVDDPSREIADICVNDVNSYLVVFADSWIGKFEDGVLNEVYVGTSYTRLVDVEKNTEGFIYLLDADSNKLIKVSIPE